MKRFVISVFLVLMVFAFIGCEEAAESGSGYDMKYLGYESSESECYDLAKGKGYDFYTYFEDGSCYGSYN